MMSRFCLSGVVPLLVAASLVLAGCDKNKNDDGKPRASAQRTGRAPDKFETSDDPPFTAATRFAAGQLAESQGNLDSAVTQYREALKIDPNHQQALFRLGAVYTQTRRFDEAIPTWQHYVKATNYSPAAYNNLALCLEAARRDADAERAYQAGIGRDPKDSSCRVNYGIMLARIGRLDDAMAQLGTVLTPAEANYNLGSVFEQAGKKEEAKAYYRKALELDPKLADARSRLAKLK
jgi:tetratricopeptide (TPR) repeat protein